MLGRFTSTTYLWRVPDEALFNLVGLLLLLRGEDKRLSAGGALPPNPLIFPSAAVILTTTTLACNTPL